MKQTKKELKRTLQLKEIDNFYRLAEAYKKIDKCSQEHYTGSGVTLTIRNINKENYVVVEEFMLLDGLSPETILAIKADIKRTYELKQSLIPKI